jgi:hypothetical protein
MTRDGQTRSLATWSDKQEALQHGATNKKPCYMERASKTAQDEQPLTTANH